MITISKLSKSYDKLVIDNFSFNFTKGIYQINGLNGTGKTTLLQCITKRTSYEGKITINGQDSLSSSDILSQYVTYITQEDNFIEHLTAKQNIDLFFQEYNNQNLNDNLARLDINNILQTKVSKLSGGERKKLQIAIGFSFARSILLLDEVDNHLDDDALITLQQMIEDHDGVVIMTSHTQFIKDVINVDLDKSNTNNLTSNDSAHVKQIDFEYKKTPVLKKIIKNWSVYAAVFIMILSIVLSYKILVRSIDIIDFFQTPDEAIFYEDTSLILSPPYERFSNSALSTSEWYVTTPFAFTDENISALEESKYVKTVEPINDFKFMTTTITVDDIEYYTDGFNSFSYDMSPLPKRITEKTSFPVGLPASELEYEGRLPNDNSFECIVPKDLAKQNNLKIGDQLIIKGTSESDEILDIKFKIVGTYTSEVANEVYGSYQNNSRFLFEYDISTNEAALERYVKYVEANTTNKSLENIVDLDNTTYYSSLFIETYSADDTINLIKQIQSYDPYLAIYSNFMGSTSLIEQYKNEKKVNIGINIAIINSLFLLMCMLLAIYQLRTFSKNYMPKLLSYGYSDALLISIYKKNNNRYRQLFILYVIINLVFVIVFRSMLIYIPFVATALMCVFMITILRILQKKIIGV